MPECDTGVLKAGKKFFCHVNSFLIYPNFLSFTVDDGLGFH